MDKKAVNIKSVIDFLRRLKGMGMRGAQGFGRGVKQIPGDIKNVFSGIPLEQSIRSEPFIISGRSGLLGHRLGRWGTLPVGTIGITEALRPGNPDQAKLAYDQGFIDKCAEMGVDPEALVKQLHE